MRGCSLLDREREDESALGGTDFHLRVLHSGSYLLMTIPEYNIWKAIPI